MITHSQSFPPDQRIVVDQVRTVVHPYLRKSCSLFSPVLNGTQDRSENETVGNGSLKDHVSGSPISTCVLFYYDRPCSSLLLSLLGRQAGLILCKQRRLLPQLPSWWRHTSRNNRLHFWIINPDCFHLFTNCHLCVFAQVQVQCKESQVSNIKCRSNVIFIVKSVLPEWHNMTWTWCGNVCFHCKS